MNGEKKEKIPKTGPGNEKSNENKAKEAGDKADRLLNDGKKAKTGFVFYKAVFVLETSVLNRSDRQRGVLKGQINFNFGKKFPLKNFRKNGSMTEVKIMPAVNEEIGKKQKKSFFQKKSRGNLVYPGKAIKKKFKKKGNHQRLDTLIGAIKKKKPDFSATGFLAVLPGKDNCLPDRREKIFSRHWFEFNSFGKIGKACKAMIKDHNVCMMKVISSAKKVAGQSEKVKINQEKVLAVATQIKNFAQKEAKISLTHYQWDFETLVQITFVFNVINYCFWAKKGEPKWTVKFGTEEADGSKAAFRCLEEAVKQDRNFLKGETLVRLNRKTLAKILAGNVTITLFEERLCGLNEAGLVLEKKFAGSFLSFYRQVKDDALMMAEMLKNNFPSFEDKAIYKGEEVFFYKRAQLNSKVISDLRVIYGKKELKNLNKLSAFADYKVPQKLRSLGILEYAPDLAYKIDGLELIEAGSPEEVEIRASTVWAIELIKKSLKKAGFEICSAQIDSALWNLSQTKEKEEKPYHRTLTTAY